LLEYESKEIFRQFDIPLVKNLLILRGEDIEDKVKGFSFPAIVKSQIAIGSRKKAGLIKIAKSVNEAILLCNEYFNRNIAGFQVEAILIEELVTIEHEYYCSIALDASGRQFFLIASKEGGIDIEEVAKTTPDAILKESFSFQDGVSEVLASEIAHQLGFSGKQIVTASRIFMKLWDIALKLEAQLVEINPLVMTPSGLIAVDGKMILDDDAAFRQPIIQTLQERKLSEREKLAKKAGFSFVELSGEIGILAKGLQSANFLDVGGGASKDRVYKALELIFKLQPKVVLVNIFGGITRCDIVAQAIIQTLKDFSDAPPMVIRLTGTNEKEGIALLKEANMDAFQDIMDAVKKVKEVLSE
jgi:succinyl-CoA synthetase beta subunit